VKETNVTSTRVRATSRVRATAAAAVALAAVLLSGCASTQAGAATVVGGVAVSDREVAESVEELLAQVAGVEGAEPLDEATATRVTVERYTRELLFAEGAAREGVTVTQAEVDDIIAQTVEGQFGGDRAAFEAALATQQAVPASEVATFARDFVLRSKLVEKLSPSGDTEVISAYLEQLSADVGVEVSPRFGTWDPANVSLGPVPDDLSSPAPLAPEPVRPAPVAPVG
jgi:hypothetical protein